MRFPRRRSDCPISSALDLLGDKWSLLVMRDVLLRGKSHYREFAASEEHIATNILADRLTRLEGGGLLERDAGEPRSGKQAYHATAKGKDLIPLLLQMMAWSAAHDSQVAVPGPLLAAITADLPATARAIRDLGGVEPFLAMLDPDSGFGRQLPAAGPFARHPRSVATIMRVSYRYKSNWSDRVERRYLPYLSRALHRR